MPTARILAASWHTACVLLSAAFLAGCSSCGGAATSTARPTGETTGSEVTASGPDEICSGIYGGLRRALDSRCSERDKRSPQYAYLVSLVEEPRRGCEAVLARAASGRIAFRLDRARACGAALEAISWKETFGALDLSRVPACRGLFQGRQQVGEACASSLECVDGLRCSGAKLGPAPREGACRPPAPAAEACDLFPLPIGGETHSPCGAGSSCVGEIYGRAHPLGGSAVEPPAFEMAGSAEPEAADTPFSDPPAPHTAGQPFVREGAGVMLDEIPGFIARPQGLDSLRMETKRSGLRVRGDRGDRGRLPAQFILRVLRASFPGLRSCYESALRDKPGHEARVHVGFVIGRNGAAIDVSAAGVDTPLANCVRKQIYGLSFPEPEGGTITVRYPLVFGLGGDPPAPASSASSSPSAATTAPTPSEPWQSPFAGVTASCRKRGAPRRVALDEDCSGGSRCGDGLYCSHARGSGYDGVCRRRKPAGQACSSSLQCEGRCDFTTRRCVSFCGR